MIIRRKKNKKEENPFYDPSLKNRHKSSRRFKLFTLASLIFSIAFLAFFLTDIVTKGAPAFKQAYLLVDVTYNEASIKNYRKSIDRKYTGVVSRAWIREVPNMIEKDPSLMGKTVSTWVLADDQVDQYLKGHYYKLKRKDRIIVDDLKAENKARLQFNKLFFENGDSKTPEYAGFKSAIIGSVLTLLITMLVAFPIGVMTAIYLEEFAEDNKFTQIIEVNINNLAAIPSILFGLLGLAIFISLFGLPRSSPLVGGSWTYKNSSN
jgi:phosphate transport system permease protein